MIWFEIVLKLVGNELDFVWKFVGFLSITINKSNWYYWVVLKGTYSSLEKD